MKLTEAQEHAKKNGCTGEVYFISDKWGGYWQAAGPHGPYNFRLPDKTTTGRAALGAEEKGERS